MGNERLRQGRQGQGRLHQNHTVNDQVDTAGAECQEYYVHVESFEMLMEIVEIDTPNLYRK